MFPTLHILADQQNVVGWRLALKYMGTPMTHYFLESSGQVAYMETHPKVAIQPLSSGPLEYEGP